MTEDDGRLAGHCHMYYHFNDDQRTIRELLRLRFEYPDKVYEAFIEGGM